MTESSVERLQKGDLILVCWDDASDTKGPLSEHEANPSVVCKDWGIFLGVGGLVRRFLILGKDVVEVHNSWGATRIPLELIRSVVVIVSRDRMVEFVKEIQVLDRRIKLRRYGREARYVNL